VINTTFFGTTALANDLSISQEKGGRFFLFFSTVFFSTVGPSPKVHHACFSFFTDLSLPILTDALILNRPQIVLFSIV
jgi:hypothetical protein